MQGAADARGSVTDADAVQREQPGGRRPRSVCALPPVVGTVARFTRRRDAASEIVGRAGRSTLPALVGGGTARGERIFEPLHVSLRGGAPPACMRFA